MSHLPHETNKGLSVFWSLDDECRSELDGETVKHVTNFSDRCESDDEYRDEGLTFEDLLDLSVETKPLCRQILVLKMNPCVIKSLC